MNRFALSAFTAATLLLPHLAAATSAELLQAAAFDGQPRDFRLELHGTDGITYFSAWGNGGIDGLDDAMKASVATTVDIFKDGVTMRSRYEMRVLNKTAYFRLTEIFNTPADRGVPKNIEALKGHWFSSPLQATDLTAAAAVPLLQGTMDEAFTESSTGFVGGISHTLTLKPDFLRKALADLGSSDLVPDGFLSFADAMPAVETVIKIDTDEEGNFEFGRLTVSAVFDGLSLRLKSQSWLSGTHVAVQAPADAAPAANLSGLLGGLSSTVTLPGTGLTPIVPASFEEAPVVRIAPTAQRETVRQNADPACDVEPALQAHLIRKGLCPTPENSRPRRGTQRR